MEDIVLVCSMVSVIFDKEGAEKELRRPIRDKAGQDE
jgi:hypothetical protein